MSKARSLLDRPISRIVALMVFIGLASALLLPDWRGVFTYGGARPENAQLTECLKTRLGDVREMRAEGTIGDSQAARFRERARNFCHGRYGG